MVMFPHIDFLDLKSQHFSEVLRMMKDFYAIDNYPIDEKLSLKNFEFFVENPSAGKAYLINYGIEPAGYIIVVKIFSFEFGGYIWLLDELYVDPRFQGKSIGKKAVDFIIQESKKQHIPVVLLEVENHNHRAISLYENNGFEMHKRSLMILKNDK